MEIPTANTFTIPVLKTDTFLDDMTGIWGLPRKRIIEFFGEEKTGKSTAAFHVIASAQKQGLRCLLVDIEHSLDPMYLPKLGVDPKKLGVIVREYAEEYLDATLEAINSNEWDLIVFDSIGSLSSKIEHEKASGEKTIGLQASQLTVFVRKIAPKISLKNMVFIGINHSRTDIMTGKIFTMGGRVWSEKKKLSIRFREKSGVLLKSGENVVGKVITIEVMKNAVGSTERKQKDVQLIFGAGFSASANLLDEAITKGVIEKVGNLFYFEGEKIGMITKAREWIAEESNSQRISEKLNG